MTGRCTALPRMKPEAVRKPLLSRWPAFYPSDGALAGGSQTHIGGRLVGAGFSGRGNVLCPSAFQNLLCAFGPIGVVGVDRQQNPTILHLAFVAFGLVFGDAHSD